MKNKNFMYFIAINEAKKEALDSAGSIYFLHRGVGLLGKFQEMNSLEIYIYAFQILGILVKKLKV